MKSQRTTIQLVNNGNLATNLTSDVWGVQSYPLISVHAYISSGTASGSITVQVSNYEDNFTDGYYPGNPYGTLPLNTLIPQWVNLESVKTFPVANAYTATTITNSVPSNVFLDLDLTGWKWMRIVYTRTSGSGLLQCFVTGKRNKSTTI